LKERTSEGKTPKGYIFNIQRYSLHDGPGLRTTIFLKGCPLRCLWCSNPESQNPFPEIMFSEKKCKQCGECIPICPNNALHKGDHTLIINREVCNSCGKCEEICVYDAIKIIGKKYSVEEIMNEIKKDTIFYRSSKGGITISGGEPLFQVEFAKSILEECKIYNIHTAIQTSGYSEFSDLLYILPYVDLFIYDFKHIDPYIHEKLTGVKNDIIIENLERLVKYASNRVIIQIPIIPSINDSKEHITKVASFISQLKDKILGINIIPYHKLGIPKYIALGRHYHLSDLEVPQQAHIEEIKRIFQFFNIPIISFE
jgi:pyruvate formate lyase activating enzyme